MMSRRFVCLILLVGWTLPVHAATPPTLVNYQGVLRDNNDKPLTGTFDMTFGFYDAQSVGNQILLDAHTGASAVGVSGGQFNVLLGSGAVSDGSGPGTYTALDQVFRDYPAVWMEIVVGVETLSPRIRVVGAPYALNASNLEGKNAASFIDTSSAGQTKAGTLNVNGGMNISGTGFGLNSNGTQAGGAFGAGNSFAYVADLGSLHSGIRAQGDDVGGWFVNNLTGSNAYCAYGNYGIQAQGPQAGGYFLNSNGQVYAQCGGTDTGVDAQGTFAGGIFRNSNNTSFAYNAREGWGILAYGQNSGGEFVSFSGSGAGKVAYGDYGVYASGKYPNGVGGYFFDNSYSGKAWLGDHDLGVWGQGLQAGGYFTKPGTTAQVYLGAGDGKLFYQDGVYALSNSPNDAPGLFWDLYSGAYSYVGKAIYKVLGNGNVSFVQNDPFDASRVIVYAAPEGDETAVYTRGTARLQDGVARVRLGETFARVTNPDTGLTAQLTPHGAAVPLAVDSVTTTELVVRGPAAGPQDVVFDYAVWGLRIGFEDRAVVQPKKGEAFIPSMESDARLYEANPDLKGFTARGRFARMEAAADPARASSRGGAASEALKAAIHVYDRATDLPKLLDEPPSPPRAPQAAGMQPTTPALGSPGPAASPVAGRAPSPPTPPTGPASASGGRDTASVSTFPLNTSAADIDEPVEAGEVLVNDAARPGLLRRADQAVDAGVVGIVAGEAGAIWRDRAPIVLAGTIVSCKVDASYGAIQPNDLLVASPTPGHAMRAGDSSRQGTVVAKALEPLEAGSGTIRVLAMSR